MQIQIQILRAYELRLLRCTFTPPSSDSPSFPPSASDDTHTILNRILSLIESGHYLDALSSAAAANVVIGEGESPDQVCSDLVRRVEQFVLSNDDEEEGRLCRVILVSCIAVAAFFCFIQCNITGPQDGLLPQCPPQFRTSAEWDNWARNHLMSHGSQLLAKFSHLQYLVLAETLIMSSKDLLIQGSLSSECEVRSISWWLARLLLTEQRILDELSSSLFDLLQVNMATTLNHFGSLEQVKDYWGPNLLHEEALDIVSMVHLEAGTMEYTYGRVDSCREKFRLAEAASGLQLSVTGVLGYRTVHQVEPKAQRVLINEGSSSKNGLLSHSTSPGTQENNHPLENNLHGHPREMLESDILRTPKLLECSNQSGNGAEDDENSGLGDSTPLKPIQQAVVLSWCLLIEISTRHDELQRWDMAPFIEAIDSQPTLFFTLQCFHDLLRVRWESSRSRTKGRALEMMEKLVESVRSPLPGVGHRIPFCYVANIPTIPALQKEYAQILISCGLVGEAIAIFEKLELWDNLIYCYRLLEKKAAAVELIKKRLSEIPDDPRLWCSLGDVTNNDSCYEKALEVSNNKSARAKRSLARSAYNRGDYETSKNLWESAMAMNSLYPDGWFAFGAAALKAGDVDKALVGFTKAVQLDPESGEAWNNIACLHMVKKRSEESFIAFKEAIKFKRDSWQMWENYSHVAMDVGNIHQALEAIQNVLRMSSSKRVDTESFTKLLERVVVDMEERALRKNSVIPAVADGSFTEETSLDSQQGSQNKPELRVELSRETEQLMDVLGKILQQMVKNGSGADVWGLYARWHKIKGDLTMCSEALLKQVRSYQGSDLWKDGERFKKFAQASLELCKVYMEISSSTGSHRELITAELHLRNVIKQAERFSGTEEFKDLQACLDEVKTKLQSTTQK